MARDEWRVASGAWQLARGEWRVARGEWRVAIGAWRVARGAWCMVHGAWCVVCRGDASVKGLETPLTATGEFGRFMRRGEAEGELARLAAAKQRAQVS